MKTYKANRKGAINYLLVVTLLFPFLIYFLDKNEFAENPVMILPAILPCALLLWAYLNTSYKIDNDRLVYRSAFLLGKIDIHKINEITKGKTMWAGTKPALAKNGLIIKYNKFDEIYIAPESNDEVIGDLLEINSKIVVHD